MNADSETSPQDVRTVRQVRNPVYVRFSSLWIIGREGKRTAMERKKERGVRLDDLSHNPLSREVGSYMVPGGRMKLLRR